MSIPTRFRIVFLSLLLPITGFSQQYENYTAVAGPPKEKPRNATVIVPPPPLPRMDADFAPPDPPCVPTRRLTEEEIRLAKVAANFDQCVHSLQTCNKNCETRYPYPKEGIRSYPSPYYGCIEECEVERRLCNSNWRFTQVDEVENRNCPSQVNKPVGNADESSRAVEKASVTHTDFMPAKFLNGEKIFCSDEVGIGSVTLNVNIDEHGAVYLVTIIRSNNSALSEKAAAMVKTWSYEPAKVNNNSVSSKIEVPVNCS